jgi:hypothetical protein
MEEQELKKITMKKGASRTMLYIDYICPPGLKAALNGNQGCHLILGPMRFFKRDFPW